MQKKRILAALLSAAMVITSAAVPVLAEPEDSTNPGPQTTPNPTTATGNWTEQVESLEGAPEGYMVSDDGNSITISSAAGLAWVAKQVNSGNDSYTGKTITLTQSIDLSDHYWTPIGNSDYSFKGTFTTQAQEDTITGLRINNPGESYQGLFGNVGGAVIKNITISDAIVEGGLYTGTLIGGVPLNTYGTFAVGATVTNCNASVIKVTGGAYTGGMIGNAVTCGINNENNTSCKVTDADVSGADWVGGFAGQGFGGINGYGGSNGDNNWRQDTTVSVERATVTSDVWKVGGVFGQPGGGSRNFWHLSAKNCTIIVKGKGYPQADGSVYEGNYAGGIVGFANASNSGYTLHNCEAENIVIISGDEDDKQIVGAGGLVGSYRFGKLTFDNCSVKNCTIGDEETTLKNCGGVFGGDYWDSKTANGAGYDNVITLDTVSAEDIHFKCSAAESIGSVFGNTLGVNVGRTNPTQYSLNSVTVNGEADVDDKDDFTLYMLGTNYPSGETEYDNSETNITFEDGNKIPNDVTRFASPDQRITQNPDGTITAAAVETVLTINKTDDDNVFDLVLRGSNSKIEDFKSAQFKIINSTEDKVAYTLEPAEGDKDSEVAPYTFGMEKSLTEDDVYTIFVSPLNETEPKVGEETQGAGIVIGHITLGGYGSGTLSIEKDNLQVHGQTTDSLVTDMDVNTGSVSYDISPQTANLTVTVQFPNTVLAQSANYTDMQVAVASVIDPHEAVKLGKDTAGVTYTSVEDAGDDGYASYSFKTEVYTNTRYTLAFTGAGYRTYTVDIVIPENETEASVTVWNNAMDTPDHVVFEAGEKKIEKDITFLAGDIVKDNDINLYDLSAVVAYFGHDNTESNAGLTDVDDKYAQYDLNRDGQIDSKDIAMVLVSWGK